MCKNASRLVTAIFLISSMAIATGANAALVKLTATGTYHQVDTDPNTGSLGTYGNANGSMPFAEAAEGTQVTFSIIVDTASISGSPSGTPFGDASFTASDATLSFGGTGFSSDNASMGILNDFPTGLLPLSIQLVGPFADIWNIVGTLPNGHRFGVSLIEGSTSIPIPALSDANFSVPDPRDFTSPLMYYYGNGGIGYDYMVLAVDTIVAQPVPVPGAALFFSSALLALSGLRSKNKA